MIIMLLSCILCMLTANNMVAKTLTKELSVSSLVKGLTDEGEATNSSVTLDLKRSGITGHKYSITTEDGWKFSLSDAYVHSDEVDIFQASYARFSTTSNRRILKIVFEDYGEHNGVFVYHNTYNGDLSSDYENGGREGYGTISNAVWTPRFGDTEYNVSFVVVGETRKSFEKGYVSYKGKVVITYEEDDEKYHEKITPTIGVEFPVLDAPINQTKITEPTVVVYEDSEKLIRTSTNFALNYFIDMEPIQNPCVDSNTGSSVNLFTGEVVAGSNPGEFRVVVRCYPVDEEQARKYNTAVAHYIVKVHGDQGYIKYNGNVIKDRNTPYKVTTYKDVEIVYPSISIVDEFNRDISDHYILDKPEVVVTDKNGKNHTINDYISLNSTAKVLKGIHLTDGVNVHLSFTPTAVYKSAYDKAEMNIVLKVIQRRGTRDAHVVFESTELSKDQKDLVVFKRRSGYFNELIVKVYDEFDNDISNNFNLTYKNIGRIAAMSYYKSTNYTDMEINHLTADEAAYNNQIYKNTEGYIDAKEGDPLFKTGNMTTEDGKEEKVVFTVYPMTNAFNTVNGTLNVKITQKYPDVVISPEEITIKTGNRWYSNNKVNPFSLEAYSILEIKDKVGGKNWEIRSNELPDGITYKRVSNYYYGDYFYFTGEKEGTYLVPIHVTAWDEYEVRSGWYWGTNKERQYYDPTVVYLKVNVVKKITPVVKFSESDVVIRNGQKIVEPTLTITDANGEDISEQYTLKYIGQYYNSKTEQYGTNNEIFSPGDLRWDGGKRYSTTGKINTSARDGFYEIDVVATPINTEDYEEGIANYSIYIFTPTWNYVINDEKGSKQYGKISFVGTASDEKNENTYIYPGTIINAVPGLEVAFGAMNSYYLWNVMKTEPENEPKDGKDDAEAEEEDPTYKDYVGHLFATSPKVIFDGSKTTQTTVLNENNTSSTEEVLYLPTAGAFLKLNPICDGFVTIDATWEAGRTYVLIDLNGDVVERETYIPEHTYTGEYRFKSSLRATDDCYFYMMPETTDNKYSYDENGDEEYGFCFYGLNYEPAFISSAADEESTTKADAYLNWNDVVDYDAEGNPKTNADGSFVTKKEKVMHKDGLPYFSHSFSNYISNTVEKGYTNWLTVDNKGIFDMNHATLGETNFVVSKHSAPIYVNGVESQTEVDANRIRVYATVASVERNDISKTACYDLMIKSIATYMVPDAFTPEVRQAVTDVEGIKMTWGGWDDHDLIDYKANDYAIQDAWAKSKLDYKLGANNSTVDGFMFESEMGGSSNAKSEKNLTYDPLAKNTFLLPCRGDYVKFEPTKAGTVYAYVLQKGCVEWNGVDAWNPEKNDMIRWRPLYIVDEHGEGVKLNTNSDGTGAYTESYYRCNNSDNETSYVNHQRKAFVFDREKRSNLTDDQYNFIDAVWPENARNSKQKVFDISTDPNAPDELKRSYTGGHILISKAYVRYTFDVLPGKTYYIFQTGSKMGFAGFSFDSSNDKVRKNPLTVNASVDYEQDVNSHTSVNYKRNLRKNKYNAFILPFSMNEGQVEKYFGKGTRISYFNDANNETNQLNFMRHYSKMIVAGDPCLIKPTFEDVDPTLYEVDANDENLITMVRIHDVSPDDRDPNVFYSSDGSWAYKGNYDYNHVVPANTYFVSNGKLYHYSEGGHTLNALYSFLEPQNAQAKKANFMVDFIDQNSQEDDMTTGVEEIYFDGVRSSTSSSGIYTVQGQKINKKLNELPAGIYIVNNKKVIIK